MVVLFCQFLAFRMSLMGESMLIFIVEIIALTTWCRQLVLLSIQMLNTTLCLK